MKNNENILMKICLNISLTMIIMSLIISPCIEKRSPEFFITIISAVINVSLVATIIIKLKIEGKKQIKSPHN